MVSYMSYKVAPSLYYKMLLVMENDYGVSVTRVCLSERKVLNLESNRKKAEDEFNH